jgi:rod shape-determining protein MreC
VVLLVALCVAGFLLGRIQNTARSEGRTDPFTSLIRTAVQPAAIPFKNVADRFDDWTLGIFSGSQIIEENRRLKAQVQSVAGYSEQVEFLTKQIDDLRKIQGFGEVPGKTRVNAAVIGYFPRENLVTLDIGSQQGISTGLPVVAPQGLLGTVQSVEKNRSQVMLLNNPALKIGAMNLTRKPPPAGFLEDLGVTFVDPKAPVEVGDLIVTSGLSDKIPGGIIIGKVIFVEDSLEQGTRRAVVDPAATLGDVRHVQVLK